MSKVTITLTDRADGRVSVEIQGAETSQVPTSAQVFGQALQAAIRQLRPCTHGMGEQICIYCDDTCTPRNGR